MDNIAKQSEILFLWDAKMTNPNGDMLNDNAPRYDEIDRRAVVSDVRVKRTIRDDLQERLNETIFVNNSEDIISAESRFREIKEKLGVKKSKDKTEDKRAFLSCIDNRLFGGVAPNSNIQIIGAVQFSWAKSLNETDIILSQGTGAFGKDGAKNKTFRTDNYIPYGLFAMYGTINRLNAKKSNATEEDIVKMLDSIWSGTKLLNTRSKVGQKPRLLIRIIYKDSYMIGLLDELVELKNENSDTIRRFDECDISFKKLIDAVEHLKSKIEKIVIYYDISTKELIDNFKKLDLEVETIEA